MLHFVITVLMCLLAAVGAAYIYERIMDALCDKKRNPPNPPYLVITAKNSQSTVEFHIRSFIWKLLSENSGKMPFDIYAVDLGSADDTYVILKKLEREYEFLHATDKAGFIDKIENEFN